VDPNRLIATQAPPMPSSSPWSSVSMAVWIRTRRREEIGADHDEACVRCSCLHPNVCQIVCQIR